MLTNRGDWYFGRDGVFYGNSASVLANSGTVHRASGFTILGINVVNTGIISADAGSLEFYSLRNEGGILRTTGGQLGVDRTVPLGTGRLEGEGPVGPFSADAGTIAPGVDGPGTLRFLTSLTLSNTVTLSIGVNPTDLINKSDRLIVNGVLSLNDAVLQLEELPMMAIGTEIILVESEGTEAVRGTFKGIPNGGLFTASKQLFRIYSQTKTCIWANRVECQDRGKQLVPETLWARAAEPS